MSRHQIDAKSPDHEAAVGWDQPMNTFFGQVHRTDLPVDSEEDDCIHWIGGVQGEVGTVEALAQGMAAYAELSPSVIELLREDQRTSAMNSSFSDRRTKQEG